MSWLLFVRVQSDSKGYDLRSTTVGAKWMSTGHPAPSHARLEKKKEEKRQSQASISPSPVGLEGVRSPLPLRSAPNGCPLDIQRPLTHDQREKRK